MFRGVTNAADLTLERIPYDPVVWASTMATHPEAEVYHSPEWLAYLAASQGAEPVLAVVRAAGRPAGYFVGATVRRYRMQILGSPLTGWGTPVMGFLLDDGIDRRAAAEALLEFSFRNRGYAHVELGDRRLTSVRMTGSRYLVECSHTYEVDLMGSEAEILARMRSTTRNYIRQALRKGLYTEVASGPDFADEYHEQLKDVFTSKGLSPTYGVERVRMLIEHLQPSEQVLLLRICDADGARIGTAIVIGRGRRALLWGTAWYRRFAGLHPNELLHWDVMRDWKSRGAAVYDMSGEGDYKAKYGGAVVPLDRFHRSRYPVLEHGRTLVRRVFYLRQRAAGRRAARAVDAEQVNEGPTST